MKSWLLMGLAVLLPSSPAVAQWTVEGAAGGTSHPQVAEAGSLSAFGELQYQGRRWGYLSAGAPLDSVATPWVVAGVGQRLSRYAGPVDLGADVSVHGHAYQSRAVDETGAGMTAELVPFVGRTFGRSRLELGSGPRFYTNSFADQTESRAVLDSSLRGSLTSDGVVLSSQVRYVFAEDGGFPFAGFGMEAVLRQATVAAHAGRWFGEVEATSWGASALVPVGVRVAISGRYDREAPDPLFWNPVRSSWGVGLRYEIGSRGAGYRAAPVEPSGTIHFRVPADEAADLVLIAGDFTSWEPTPMEMVGGAWTFALQLDPGIYHYAFQRADGSWFLPASVSARADDGFGGENAILVVGRGTDAQ